MNSSHCRYGHFFQTLKKVSDFDNMQFSLKHTHFVGNIISQECWQLVPTLCGSILHAYSTFHLPYDGKHQCFGSIGEYWEFMIHMYMYIYIYISQTWIYIYIYIYIFTYISRKTKHTPDQPLSQCLVIPPYSQSSTGGRRRSLHRYHGWQATQLNIDARSQHSWHDTVISKDAALAPDASNMLAGRLSAI